MAPSNCAVPGCSTSYKNEKNVYIKQVMSLKFLKKNSPEYKHQKLLQKFLLRYRDGKSKEDVIISQIHRGQCGICDKHFTITDFDINSAGKKKLKIGATPTQNLPSKSVIKKVVPARRRIVKYALPSPVIHRNFESLCNAIKKHHIGKLNSCWNFSLYEDKIVARYKTDVSSEFELVISLNFDLKLYYHGLFCSVSALKDFDVQKMTVSALLYKISQLHVCAGFDVEMKDAVLQVVCFRDGDTNTLLHKHIYRSPACPVVFANPDAQRCLHCSAFIKKKIFAMQQINLCPKNAKCGFEYINVLPMQAGTDYC